ncbi:MAG: phage/plasmid primase, P4 family [Desulfobacterales bacterium]
MSVSDIRKVYDIFFRPGEVVELRALGVGGKNKLWGGTFARQDQGVFGYYDNAEAFARDAWGLEQLNDPPHGIYFTINPPLPAVMARAHNRLVAVNKKRPCTSDKEIRCVRWLPIDLDVSKAVRPTGVSSSQAELDQAKEAGLQLRQLLTDLGFPDPVKGMSGNGYHLNYRIPDMDPEDAKALLKKCLAALQAQLSVEHVDVDQKVYNPSRIWKIYGTTARKGDSIPGRPHRKSFLFKSTPATFDQVEEVPLAKLQALAELAPKEETAASCNLPAKIQERKPAGGRGRTKRMHTQSLGKVQLDKYLTAYGINHRIEHKNGSTWYYMVDGCLFDKNHKGAAIIQNSDGKITHTCWHDSCSGYIWPDVRQIISGNAKIAEYCENYDPTWEPSRISGTGLLEGVEVEKPDKPGEGSLLATIINAPKEVPPLGEIHTSEFFQWRGKREKFSVQKLVSYLSILLAPIVSTDGKFYRYQNGVWAQYDDGNVRQLIVMALKDRVQGNWVSEGVTVLKDTVRREEEHWLPYPDLVNVRNGMVNLADGSLIHHDPKYCSRVQLPLDFTPEASAPRFAQFLAEIFPETGPSGAWGDGGGIKTMMLQEFMGYCLMNTCKYEKCLFMYGQGANGKSTVLKVLEQMLGEGHCGAMNIDDLANRFNIPYLQNKLINVSAEAIAKEQSAVQNLKRFISGDRVEGEWKHGERVNFAPRTKFLFAMNLPPNIQDKSHGFDRKVLVLNFNRVFDESEMDRDLGETLESELAGIFVFALEGAMRLRQQNCFTTGEIIEADKSIFMGQLNNVLMFVGEQCEIDPKARIPSDDLFESYKTWCGNSGLRPLGAPKFQEQLMHKWGVKKIKGRWPEGRRMTLVGITLMNQ